MFAGLVLCTITLHGEEPIESLPVIRVTARRMESHILSVPADIQLIRSEQIEQSQARSIPELLRQEANLHVRSTNGKGNTGELSLRGFGENSGQRVLILVDGQKMNRSDMGLIDWQQLPLENIESIEVIRGGQSTLYGNHALSGVIKITTKKGGEDQLKMKASAGSFGFYEVNTHYSGSYSNIFYTAGANHQHDNGFRENSLSWANNANVSLGSLLGDADTLLFKASVDETYMDLPGPLSYQQYRENPKQSVTPHDYVNTTNVLTTLLWEGERDWGTLQANSGFNLRNIYSELGGNEGLNEQRGYSLSPQARIGDEQNFVSGGVDTFYDTLDFDGDQGTTYNHAELNRITTGPFLFAQKGLTETLFLSGGARYELAKTDGENQAYKKGVYDRFGNYTPPEFIPDKSFDDTVRKTGWANELSLNWQPTDQFSTWIGYDRVYRYPSLDEMASYQGFTLSDPLNEDLDPEHGDQVETGVKYQSDPWSASATLFYLALDNEIAYDSVNYKNINLGATEHLGTDLQLAYDKESYGASTMLSLVQATLDEGQYNGNNVPLVPEIQNTTELWFRPIKRLRIAGNTTWLSDQYQGGDEANTRREINSYGLFGLRSDVTLTQRMTLFAKVDNLTDQHYASSAYNGGFYPGAGRAYYAGVTLEF